MITFGQLMGQPAAGGDAVLVAAAVGGDRGAFAALWVRHRGLVVGLCRRVLGDAELAEDAAQEAALHAMLSLERLRRPERFGPWLGGIGLNICRRWLRERARESWSWEAALGGRAGREPPDLSAGPEELAEEAEVTGRVRRAVAALPRGQRAAVALHYLAGLTQVEAAAALGIEVGAVKTRLHKARGALRRSLIEPEVEAPPMAAQSKGGMDSMAEEHGRGTDQPAKRVTRRRAIGLTAAGVGTAAVLAAARGDDGSPADDLIDVRIADVRRVRGEAEPPTKHVVMLGDAAGRWLPIWIGAFEGTALAMQLEGVETARPVTYPLVVSLLGAAGARLREVRVNRLAEETFYAQIVVESDTSVQTLDARPSDALNLALAAGAPARVAAAVLEAAAVTPDAGAAAWSGDRSEGAAAIVVDLPGWRRKVV